jgi:DNA (cytosine-5)-methyltransferase 1
MADRDYLSAQVLDLLPTPRATDGTKGGPNQRGSSGDLMLPSAFTHLLPTPSVADVEGGRKHRSGARSDELLLNGIAAADRFGQYAAAIDRWAPIIGRDAPDPTINGRLSPLFVEWMMGLPAGWVTDVPGMSRAQQLKALGNGVVPQQAYAALTHMINLQAAAA